MIVVESFELVEAYFGKWVFRGIWSPPATVADVTKYVINFLVDKEYEQWRNVKNEHSATFFENKAKQIFEQEWRVREVESCSILPISE